MSLHRSKIQRTNALALVSASGLLCVVSFVNAQTYITNQGGWTLPAPLATITASGDSTITNGEAATRSGLMRFSAEGESREDRDGAATPDNLRIRYNIATNIVTLGTAADIVVPALTDGRINFFGANNRSQARVITSVLLYREDTAGLEDWTLIDEQTFNSGLLDRNAGAPATTDISNTLLARFANQPAGARRYGIDVRFDVQSNANGGVPGAPGVGNLGSRVEFDFHTVADNRGAHFSVSAEPNAYNGNSRVAVDAAEARSRYGVSGLLARGVGILETGRVATTHSDFGTRVTVLAGAGGEEYETEHSFAVAGIIGSNNADSAQAGVAPRVDMLSASALDHGGVIAGANAIRGNFGAGNAGIINFSASRGATPEELDTFITANPNITWVSSVGNDALAHPAGGTYLGDVPNPNYARNNIAVGALEIDFSTAADYSSTSLGLYPAKPDVVAPGSHILSPAYRDINNNGAKDDYTRTFLGANYKREFNATDPMRVNTGDITGTSFAAPHVSGAVALLHDYSGRKSFDNRSMDHRVMKALIVGGAKTAGIVDRNGAGWQQAGTHPQEFSNFGDAIVVTRSLDRDFGGGILSASGALSMYAGSEARVSDNNARANESIDLRDGSTVAFGRNSFWDLETVNAGAGGAPGTVDYFLGGHLLSVDNIIQGFSLPTSYLRIALTWDRTVAGGGAYDALTNLELLVYADGFQAGNIAGFDARAGRRNDDYLIAKTDNLDENVKLLDFNMATLYFFSAELPQNFRPNLYIQVRNLSAGSVEYGLAASFTAVPAPASLLAFAGIIALRRRRHA